MSFYRFLHKGFFVLLLSAFVSAIPVAGLCADPAAPAKAPEQAKAPAPAAAPATAAAAPAAAPAHEVSLPPFALKGLDGTELKMEALKSYPLSIVVFFATWNPKSVPALTELQKLSDKYEKNNVAVLAINAENERTDPGFKTALEKFLADNKITITVVIDEGLTVYRSWEIKALPTTYVLNKDLKVLSSLAGAPTSYGDTIEEMIKTDLGLKAKDEGAAGAEHKRYRPADKAITLQYGMVEKKAERGRVSQALGELEEVIKKDDKFADAHALRGVLLLSEKKSGEEQKKAAKEAFDKAALLDPTLPLALIGQANFLAEGGDLKKAVELLTVAFSQSNWGARDKPENQKELLAAVEGISARLGKDDAGAKKDLLGLVDGFMTIHEGPKVNRKKMEDAAGAPAKK
jgi:peroxiredoxin